ncbi:MAG: tetratricopeptide repeat protein [Planctomycetaceae bacterium]|nr:tetratricopeptide repeat protein [Planctomycetaceae bacterium]
MSSPQDSIGHLCVSTVRALGHGIADWVRERHLDFEAGIRYRSPAGRLYAYLWWLGLVFVQVVLVLTIIDGLSRYTRSARELARGEKYLAENDFATAEACFDAALRSYPYSVAAYQYEGQLMLTRYFTGTEPDRWENDRSGRSDELSDGLTDREKLVQDGIAFLDIAIQLENKQTLPLIIQKQGDKISNAYYWRGRGRLHIGDWEKAISDFSNTIRIHPEHARAYLYRGCCNFVLRKLDAANADFDQAIAFDPTLVRSLAAEIPYQKASLELERTITSLTRQVTNLRRAPPQRNELARLHAARGDAYVLKNDLNAALADYSRCLETSEDNSEIQRRVSLVHKLATAGE